jgi:hypothetical protein
MWSVVAIDHFKALKDIVICVDDPVDGKAEDPVHPRSKKMGGL